MLAGDRVPLLPSVIAERMMVTRATMTGLIDSLTGRGLVERVSGDADGRTRPVALTTAGRELAERLVPAIHRFEYQLMGALSDRELDHLLGFVVRLQRRISEIAPDAAFRIP